MASGNMDAGNFKGVGWNVPNRFKAPGPGQQNPAEIDKGPRDEVNFGALQFTPATSETRDTGKVEDAGLITTPVPTGKVESFSPGLLDINTIGGITDKSFGIGSSLTAVNGLNTTSVFSVSGVNLASVNPLNPVALTRVPTTSVGAHGIEDTQFVTSHLETFGVEEIPREAFHVMLKAALQSDATFGTQTYCGAEVVQLITQTS